MGKRRVTNRYNMEGSSIPEWLYEKCLEHLEDPDQGIRVKMSDYIRYCCVQGLYRPVKELKHEYLRAMYGVATMELREESEE